MKSCYALGRMGLQSGRMEGVRRVLTEFTSWLCCLRAGHMADTTLIHPTGPNTQKNSTYQVHKNAYCIAPIQPDLTNLSSPPQCSFQLSSTSHIYQQTAVNKRCKIISGAAEITELLILLSCQRSLPPSETLCLALLNSVRIKATLTLMNPYLQF